MFQWIYELPTWLFAFLTIAVMCVITCSGNYCVRRWVKRDVLISHNDIAGFVVSLVGVIYAVLLSFVVVVVWEEFDAAGQFVQNEASAVANLYHLAYGLPPKTRMVLQTELRDYVNLMIQREWPDMRVGSESTGGDVLGHKVMRTVVTFVPENEAQGSIREAAITDVETFFDVRRDRLNANAISIPSILWITLILGAAIVFGLIFLFGMESARLQYTFTIGVTALVGVMFALIIELDHPFRGDTRVGPAPWVRLQTEIVTLNDFRPPR